MAFKTLQELQHWPSSCSFWFCSSNTDLFVNGGTRRGPTPLLHAQSLAYSCPSWLMALSPFFFSVFSKHHPIWESISVCPIDPRCNFYFPSLQRSLFVVLFFSVPQLDYCSWWGAFCSFSESTSLIFKNKNEPSYTCRRVKEVKQKCAASRVSLQLSPCLFQGNSEVFSFLPLWQMGICQPKS